MKKVNLLVFCLVLFKMTFSQAPEKFNYQAVIRNAVGEVISNEQVQLRFTIIRGSINGEEVYKEIHNVMTNEFGMVVLEVGGGEVIMGNIENIDWENGPYYMKVEVGIGGGNLVEVGVNQLVSVPYSLYSKKAGNAKEYTGGEGIEVIGEVIKHKSHTGDVIGVENLKVVGLQNNPVSEEMPAVNQVLKWDGTKWTPGNLSGILGLGQGLWYSGDTLNSVWSKIGDNIYNNNIGKVGIGINTPTGKLTVRGDNNSDVLFEVLDKNGRPVFVVYEDSVIVFVGNDNSKGNKGSFMVNAKAYNKSGLGTTYLRVSPDSTRIYTEDSLSGFGVRDLSSNTHSSYLNITPTNYFIGHNAGSSITSGRYNLFIGYESGKNDTSGSFNIFIGRFAGYNNKNGSRNVVIGDSAGFNIEGWGNTILGYRAGLNHLGHRATFIGAGAGFNNINGNFNTFVGNNSGFYNTNGSSNTYLGVVAGCNNSEGNHNTMIGALSGCGSIGHSNSNNTFIGSNSGRNITTGSNNCLFGSYSGYHLETGLNNIFIGYKSGYNNNGSNNVFIGSYAGQNESGSNKLYISNSSAGPDTALIYGEFDNKVLRFNSNVGIGTYPSYKLHIVGNQATGVNTGLVHVVNNASNNDVAAVYGTCASSDFYGYGGIFKGGYMGIYGKVEPTGNQYYYGVYGIVSSNQGGGNRYGVFGSANGSEGVKYGVFGIATGSGTTNYGIYGQATGATNNYAGYFEGNVHVNGTLSKNAGSFKIDHPLDPENKYLVHSFVESPDMKNIYDGVVVLDEEGKAVVTLPPYFEALNEDFRYQLTCIGEYAPVYIEKKIQNNQFVIAGGKPGLEVSWQVTGIRKDPYAKAYPIIVEEEKKPHEKGKYLNPELYGKPLEKSINYIKQDIKKDL